MPSLRFLNPTLHAQFVYELQERGFGHTVHRDGMMRCTDEQWPQINGIAHRIRDTCFPWYFSWFETRETGLAFEQHLKEHGFRFELEDHEDRLIFLLPKEDEGKHNLGLSEPLTHTHCSFCGKANTEIERFYASETAAICNECVAFLHSEERDFASKTSDA